MGGRCLLLQQLAQDHQRGASVDHELDVPAVHAGIDLEMAGATARQFRLMLTGRDLARLFACLHCRRLRSRCLDHRLVGVAREIAAADPPREKKEDGLSHVTMTDSSRRPSHKTAQGPFNATPQAEARFGDGDRPVKRMMKILFAAPLGAAGSWRMKRIVRPGMARIAATHFGFHVGVAAAPEAG